MYQRTKTEAMILNHTILEDEYLDIIIILCRTQNFAETLLRTLLSINISAHMSPKKTPNTVDININQHIQMAYAKLATMTNLQNSKIHLTTRVMFLNSFVPSRPT